MRKYDVFGKKISQIKFVYLLIIVLLIGIAGYFGVIRLQVSRLDELEQQEKVIQQQIDQLLATDEPVSYQTIDQLIPYLSQTFDQYSVNQELNFVLNATSFTRIDQYTITFNQDVPTPFTTPLPSSVKFVRIAINLTIPEPEKLLDYLNLLYGLDRIYYVQQFNVSYTTEGAIAQMVIFTFYNNIQS